MAIDDRTPRSPSFFEILQKRIQEREEQLRYARTELRELETRIAHMTHSLARLRDLLQDERALASGDVPLEVAQAVSQPRRAPVVDLVRGILERHGEPMTFAQLWSAYRGCGYQVGGKNPRNTLNAYLSSYHRRGTVFERTEDGRWGLRDWRSDQAGGAGPADGQRLADRR